MVEMGAGPICSVEKASVNQGKRFEHSSEIASQSVGCLPPYRVLVLKFDVAQPNESILPTTC